MISATPLHRMKLLVLSALLGTSLAMADDKRPRGYVMVVYSDRAQGEVVLEGEHEKAIAMLLRHDDGRAVKFADQVNLCVAFTKTRRFDQATRFCDMALASSGRETRRPVTNYSLGQYARKVAAADRAVALTNRGVLHAVAGESEEARDLFEEAQDVGVIGKYAQNNLARLRSATDDTGS